MASAESIAAALGFRRIGGRWRGPCPACGHNTCTLADGRSAPVAWCWHPACDRAALLERLRELGVLPKRELSPAERRQWAEERERRREAEAFAGAARWLADCALEQMPSNDPRRADLVSLQMRLLADPVSEAAWWRQNRPEMFRAMVAAWARQQQRWRRRTARMVEAAVEVEVGA